MFLRITTVTLLVVCFCLRDIDGTLWRSRLGQEYDTTFPFKRVHCVCAPFTLERPFVATEKQISIPSFLSRPLTTQQLHGRIQVRYQSIPICLLVFMWFVRSFVLQGYIKGYISHQHQKLVVSKQNPFPALTSFLQSVRTCVTPASSKLDIHRAFIHLDVASSLTHSAKQEFAGTFLLKYSKVRKVSVYSD